MTLDVRLSVNTYDRGEFNYVGFAPFTRTQRRFQVCGMQIGAVISIGYLLPNN